MGEPRPPRTCLITDRHAVGGLDPLLLACIGAARGGIDAIQVREKDLTARELFKFCLRLKGALVEFPTKILVNDRVDIAIAAGLDGVHLSYESSVPVARARAVLGPQTLIGVSTHQPHEVREVSSSGSSFCLFGPVYETPSKRQYGAPQGLQRLREAVAAAPVGFPVLALGGVEPERFADVQAHGASGAAGIRALLTGGEPELLAARWKQYWGQSVD